MTTDTSPLFITAYKEHSAAAVALTTAPTTLTPPAGFNPRFLRLQPDSTVLATVGSGGAAPADPTAGSLRIDGGEWIQLDGSGAPVKVAAQAGTANVCPVWAK